MRQAKRILLIGIMLLPFLFEGCCDPQHPEKNPCQIAVGIVRAGLQYEGYTVK